MIVAHLEGQKPEWRWICGAQRKTLCAGAVGEFRFACVILRPNRSRLASALVGTGSFVQAEVYNAEDGRRRLHETGPCGVLAIRGIGQ